VNLVIDLRVPQNAVKLSIDFTTGGLSSSGQLHSLLVYMKFQISLHKIFLKLL
jgi:hypothetical protein